MTRRKKRRTEGGIERTAAGTYKVVVDLGPPDVVTGRRNRVRRTLKTEDEAKRVLREVLVKRDRGALVAPERVRVADWLNGWLARHRAEGHIAATTHGRYAVIIRLHLIPTLGAYRLSDLRPDHINRVKAAWLSGEDSTARAPLSPATVRQHLVILQTALASAVEQGVIEQNPMGRVRLPSVRATGEKRALTEQEIVKLRKAAAGTRYDVAIRLTLSTGLRQSELLGLRWEDCDLDAGVLRVAQALSYVGGGVEFHEPKSARSRRTIQLSPATVEMLRHHRVAQAERKLRLGPEGWIEHGLVFPSTIGVPWTPRNHSRDYRTVLPRSKIDNIETVNWHTLRHTAGSQWIRAGASLIEVARRLGHSSTDFTQRTYIHTFADQQDASAHALDRLLG